MVTGTKFKLEKFEYKVAKNPSTGEEDDVSELTLLNTETNDRAVLILNKIVDSPEFYVLFDYQWPEPDAASAEAHRIQGEETGGIRSPPQYDREGSIQTD